MSENKDSNNLLRRDFLQTGVAAIGAIASSSYAWGQEKKPAGKPKFKGWIDAHSHVWTPDTDKFPLGAWNKKSELNPASFTAAELLQIANPLGVDRVVLIQHAPYHGYDNSYILDCAKRYPGVFSVVAMIDERLPNVAGRLKKLKQQGTRGIRIGPTKHADRTLVKDPAKWLESEGQQALWKAASKLNVAICPLINPEFLPSLDVMCVPFPDVTCVIDHFGRVDVGQKEEIKQLTKLARHPNVYVKVSAFYSKGKKAPPHLEVIPMINQVVDAFGPDRLMWGSDCPYQLNNGNNYEDSVALFESRIKGLSKNDREQILRDTAKRVFFD